MNVKQFRDRTSDKKMYPIETLRRIVKEISTDEQDEFISIMGRRLYESQYVCFSRREVQELVRACLQEMSHEEV